MYTEDQELERAYAEAKPVEGFQELPDGDYLCQVAEAELRDNKNNTGQHLFAKLIIIAGNHQGSFVFHRNALTPTAMGFVRGSAKALGMEFATVAELKVRWPEAVGKEVVGRLYTSKKEGSEQQSYLVSPKPVQEDYKKRLLALAAQKGFANDSVNQMAMALYRRGLDECTTTELKALGQRMQQPQAAAVSSVPNSEDFPF